MFIVFTENFNCGILEGAAGTGKTWMFMLKIPVIVRTSPVPVLLIAPHPHTIRCKKLLTNSYDVYETDVLPVPAHVTARVIIMDGAKFFPYDNQVCAQNCQEASKYHVFIDDGHKYDEQIRACSEHVERLFSSTTNVRLISYDRMQQTDPSDSFLTSTTLPKYEFTGVLRNTVEVAEAVEVVRQKRDDIWKITTSTISTGHMIQG